MLAPKVPVAQEGYPFIGFSAFLTLLFAILGLTGPALLTLLATVTGQSIQHWEAQLAGQGYGSLKKTAAEAVVAFLEPVQQRYRELRGEGGELMRILNDGADKAAARAEVTLRSAMDVLGFIPRK